MVQHQCVAVPRHRFQRANFRNNKLFSRWFYASCTGRPEPTQCSAHTNPGIKVPTHCALLGVSGCSEGPSRCKALTLRLHTARASCPRFTDGWEAWNALPVIKGLSPYNGESNGKENGK